METEDRSRKFSSVGTVYVVASDFNPAMKVAKDHKSSIGTTHFNCELKQ
jgi:hypothetical protein